MSSPINLPRHRPVKHAFLFVFLSLALISCRPPSGGAATSSAAEGRTVSAAFVGQPALGEVPVRVTVLMNGAPVSGAQVEVTGDITHAGMSPVLAEAEDQGDGTYKTQNFAFDMAGDWIITVDVTYPDGVKLSKNLAASVPGG